MSEKEIQAHDNVRWRNWSRAVTLYDQILNSPPYNQSVNSRGLKDRQISCLLGRCECLLELGKYELCLNDARKILTLLSEQKADCLASVSRTRRWLVRSLCKLKKFSEAEQILREWILELSSQTLFTDICKTLARYKSIVHTLANSRSIQKFSNSYLEDEMSTLNTKLDHWASNNLPLDKFSKILSNKGAKKRDNTNHNGPIGGQSNTSTIDSISSIILQKNTELLTGIKIANSRLGCLDENGDKSKLTTCSYCATTFLTRSELKQHCQTEAHQKVIMSDEGRDWKWRPPPRGYTLDSYGLCESWCEFQTCHYGNQCVEAHGQDELNEWKERFEYRRMRVQKAWEKELYGKSYTEDILEKWIQSTVPEKVMCDKVDNIEINCEQDLVTTISSKPSQREWIFVLKSNDRPIKAVALLQDAHRNHFSIKAIILGGSTEPIELRTNQEWVANKTTVTGNNTMAAISGIHCNFNDKNDTKCPTQPSSSVSSSTPFEYTVVLQFHTEIYGTFRQAVCFDFGTEPMLVRHLCVDVVPLNDVEKIEEIKRDIINSSATRWDASNTNLVKFDTMVGSHLKTTYLSDLQHEKDLLERYPCPRAQTFTLTQSTIMEKRLTENNYRSRIHELLYVEEIARCEQIARFNLTANLAITSHYMLTPAGMATSTAKYSLAGELFALMHLSKDISEDTSAGRLILSNCSSVYISPIDTDAEKDKRNVYETLIEDKSKNVIYLKLSTKCVEEMKLKSDTEIDVDIQFQLNRLQYCEWHHAVDKITDFKIIFPSTEIEPNIPWTPKKQWTEACEPKLNTKQREAVTAITTSLGVKLPPILLIGPFGTGKTYTLAQAIKQLLIQPKAKILICTHSNSAADLYIKEYLHPWVEEGLTEATPLRVYYHKRWVATVNNIVQKYCITDGAGNFRRPNVDDIMKHRIVVVTLNISMELANLDLPKGYFTHIFLDEAAQAMECEAIMPLALANDKTRIVLAGDHMQMSPELFSTFAKERKLHISLLERLYDHYPTNFPCKILLCENYRAHEAIIRFTSELFYEQKLIASGKQPRHEKFYPLTFFTTRGEDIQDKNSTAFYNNAEVYEVVERVSELRKKWPSAWGKINETSIGIMTPYADQVFRIRSELRKRRMGGISVERVLNVQGKQFRVVFLSTVRTRRTCLPNGMNCAGGFPGQSFNPSEDSDYGFLSNSKLLNTAITRAQSLVAVVGDPVALCSIGRCRKVWERFIEICHENKSLFGITMLQLRSQLDGVELKRGYVLNPLAPEFVPRALQPEAYLRDQAAMFFAMTGMTNNQHSLGQLNSAHAASMLGPHPGITTAANAQLSNQHPNGIPNQQMQHLYGSHPAALGYNTAAAAAMLSQTMLGNKGGLNYSNHMGIRPIGPSQSGITSQQTSQQQGPSLAGQPFNQRGPAPLPAVHVGQPPNSYLPWHNQQTLRNGPQSNANTFPSIPNQQTGVATNQNQNQNPNANLWGPPPQSNPWSTLPKQQAQQASNGNNNRQIPPQQIVQNIRGNNVSLQPASLNNGQQIRNPSDLGFLANKALYTNKITASTNQLPPQTQPHLNYSNFGCNIPPTQLSMVNLRNISGIPNGPMSPMDTFMQRPLNTGTSQNSFFNQNNLSAVQKEKTFELLGNVHLPNSFPVQTTNALTTTVNSKQQSPTPHRFPQPYESLSLLPSNMNIYEMAFEPKEAQYKWYMKLLEIHGQEVAAKFMDALRNATALLQQQSNIGLKASHLTAPNPLIARELMQPIMAFQAQLAQQTHLQAQAQNIQHQQAQQQQQQQQQLQQQQRAVMPFVGRTNLPSLGSLLQAPLSMAVPNDETAIPVPPIDNNINFNQQIDMAFNSIINGNEISQPILRDLFGMDNAGNVSDINVSDLLLKSTATPTSNTNIFSDNSPTMGILGLQNTATSHSNVASKNSLVTNIYAAAGTSAHQPSQPAQPQQPMTIPNNFGSFIGNNPLLNKEFMVGRNLASPTPSSSVPLYRRQGIPMSNGHSVNSVAITNSNHSMPSTTPSDSMLTGNTNDILTGLGTGTASNIIEALFQNNNQQQTQELQQFQQQQNQLQQNQHQQNQLQQNQLQQNQLQHNQHQQNQLQQNQLQHNQHQQNLHQQSQHQQNQHQQNLHQQNQQQQQQQSTNNCNTNFQKLLYNNFNNVGNKTNDIDLFMCNNTSFTTNLVENVNNTGAYQSTIPQSSSQNDELTKINSTSNEIRNNVTYAAVLLNQGPQQQKLQQQQQQQQQQAHHQQQSQSQAQSQSRTLLSHNSLGANKSGSHGGGDSIASNVSGNVNAIGCIGSGIASGIGDNIGAGGGIGTITSNNGNNVVSCTSGSNNGSVAVNNLSNAFNGLGVSITSQLSNNTTGIEKDPFAAIRELGQATSGYYNYFQ